MITQQDLDQAKAYVDAVKRSEGHIPTHRYTKLLAFATERYELLLDQFTAEFCATYEDRKADNLNRMYHVVYGE